MDIDKAKWYLREHSKKTMNDNFIEAVEKVLEEFAMLEGKIQEYKSKEVVVIDINTIIGAIKGKHEKTKTDMRHLERLFNKSISPAKTQEIRKQLNELDLKQQAYTEIIDLIQGL